jgi:hypothetical protein
MADEVQMASILVIITIAIPMFLIANETKALISSPSLPIPSPAAGSSNNINDAGNHNHDGKPSTAPSSSAAHLKRDNPEQALYTTYNLQAVEELNRCFNSSQKGMCEGSIDLIVNTCTSSRVDISVCHDPRVERIVASR